jgi:hypothetical protein
MIKIKLMPDYGCYPLWWDEPNLVGNINPSELPLSDSTIESLHQWTLLFDTHLDWDNPGNSPELSVHELKEFESEGLRLWLLLIDELSSNYEVSYKSHYLHQVFTDPNELKDRLLTIE